MAKFQATDIAYPVQVLAGRVIADANGKPLLSLHRCTPSPEDHHAVSPVTADRLVHFIVAAMNGEEK